MAAGRRAHRTVGWILFVAYLILLCYFLFFAGEFGRRIVGRDYRYNLTLFGEIRRYLHYPKELGLRSVLINLAGNVLAFVPFGIFWRLLWGDKMNWFATTLCTFSFSMAVETLQLLTRLGCFDVDDVFLNTLGGALGAVLYLLFYKKKRKGTRQKSESKKAKRV